MQRARMMLRGLIKHCPRCGSGGLFQSFFTLRPACPRCGLRFDREDGYWVGAMTIAIVLTMLLFIAVMAVVIIATWPDLPVVPLIVLGIALNTIFPIVSYPTMKTLWLAVDLNYFHPEVMRQAWVPPQSGSASSGSSASAPHSDQEPS